MEQLSINSFCLAGQDYSLLIGQRRGTLKPRSVSGQRGD